MHTLRQTFVDAALCLLYHPFSCSCFSTRTSGPATQLCMQSVDLSALGAQALAQVEKARKAAAESLASALNQKPKLDLTLELDAPKVAIPVPATEDGRGE